MRFSIWPGPTSPWEDTLAVARHAEATGWDGLWLADHFMPSTAAEGSGFAPATGPWHESWTTLSAIGALVPRIRIGTLVSGNTYRHPAVLAKITATLDNITAGRVVLGLGAGWQENEHQAYGIEFSTLGGRLRRLEEACQVITGLFSGELTDFEGKYYRLQQAPLDPKPVQKPIPFLIGGGGEKRTMRIAAQYANEWNTWGTPELLRHKNGVLDAHCRDLGRGPGEIERTAVALLVMTTDEQILERSRAQGRPMIAGDVEAVRRTIAEYRDAGVHELVIPDWTMGRGDRKWTTMSTFMEKVASEFR